jgi:hypothetical protein
LYLRVFLCLHISILCNCQGHGRGILVFSYCFWIFKWGSCWRVLNTHQNWPSVVSIDMRHRIFFYIEWRVAALVIKLSPVIIWFFVSLSFLTGNVQHYSFYFLFFNFSLLSLNFLFCSFSIYKSFFLFNLIFQLQFIIFFLYPCFFNFLFFLSI